MDMDMDSNMLDPHIWMSAQTGLNVTKIKLHFSKLGSHTWQKNEILKKKKTKNKLLKKYCNKIVKQNTETKYCNKIVEQNTEEKSSDTKS